jgi:hypothetical protein
MKNRMAHHVSRLLYNGGEGKEKARAVGHPGEIGERRRIV